MKLFLFKGRYYTQREVRRLLTNIKVGQTIKRIK